MATMKAYPSSFVCPLTMEIMDDCVMDNCAHNYERKAIEHWLSSTANQCCPISRKPLSQEDLVPNHVLAERIEKYKWQKEQGDVDYNELVKKNLTHDERSAPLQQLGNDCELTVKDDDDDSSQDDDNDSLYDGNLEMGHIKKTVRRPKRPFRMRPRSSRSRYHSLPPATTTTDLVLLPQERRMLDLARSEREAQEAQQRKRLYQRSALLCFGLVLAGVGIYQLLLRRKEGSV